MICFVASAFDHKDIDAIYDKVVRPTLQKLKIRCTRVDRIEHNDDIDDKIFALMNAADFCIADLTYARPSVYYEAGYMFGCKKPVIYIARSDHFRAKVPDPHG
jgi:nucleoside 2-deoxyribosyltransferase